MIQRILSVFSHATPPALPEPDAKLALGALMVRIAKSDDSYHVEEIQRIDRILAHSNGIGPVEAAKMRATCERLEAEAPDTERFAALIRETTSQEGRMETLGALWAVLLADGIERPEELAAITATAAALGLDAEQSAAARAAQEGS